MSENRTDGCHSRPGFICACHYLRVCPGPEPLGWILHAGHALFGNTKIKSECLCPYTKLGVHSVTCQLFGTEEKAKVVADGSAQFSAEGFKHDNGKVRFDLVDPDALTGMAKVLTHPIQSGKYPDRNWEKGMSYGRLFASVMRHLWAWWRGEDNDPESGLSHLDHAACCIHFLSAYTKHEGQGTDDRPVRK